MDIIFSSKNNTPLLLNKQSWRIQLSPDRFIKLLCTDYDKIKQLFSPKEKIKQWRTSGDLRELNIAQQYHVDRIQLTFSASVWGLCKSALLYSVLPLIHIILSISFRSSASHQWSLQREIFISFCSKYKDLITDGAHCSAHVKRPALKKTQRLSCD